MLGLAPVQGLDPLLIGSLAKPIERWKITVAERGLDPLLIGSLAKPAAKGEQCND